LEEEEDPELWTATFVS